MKLDEAYSGNVFIIAAQIKKKRRELFTECRWIGRFRSARVPGLDRSAFGKYASGSEEYSPYLDKHLSEIKYFDAGDLNRFRLATAKRA